MDTAYARDYFGYQDTSRLPADTIQCPMCGEPVTLIAEHLADYDE